MAWNARARSWARASPSPTPQRIPRAFQGSSLVRLHTCRMLAIFARKACAPRLVTRARQVRLRKLRNRHERDAIDRAGRKAELAPGAPARDHGMHQLRRPDDRVDGAGEDALLATDADR